MKISPILSAKGKNSIVRERSWFAKKKNWKNISDRSNENARRTFVSWKKENAYSSRKQKWRRRSSAKKRKVRTCAIRISSWSRSGKECCANTKDCKKNAPKSSKSAIYSSNACKRSKNCKCCNANTRMSCAGWNGRQSSGTTKRRGKKRSNKIKWKEGENINWTRRTMRRSGMNKREKARPKKSKNFRKSQKRSINTMRMSHNDLVQLAELIYK